MNEAKPQKQSAEAKRVKEEREKGELRDKRNHQLEDTRQALETLEQRLRSARSLVRRCHALLNHSGGFYQELDKLAKGKSLLEVTTFVLQQANDIIRDAKEIVKGDVYLDRIKEFVPAGNNPVYPDVLVCIRSVRDSLGRSSSQISARVESIKEILRKAQTVAGALQYFLDDEGGNQEEKKYPSRKAVDAYVEGDMSDFCFTRYRDSHEEYFDFDRLDEQTIPEYLSMLEKEGPDGFDADSQDEEDDTDLDLSSEEQDRGA